MDKNLKGIHLIFNDSPIYAINESSIKNNNLYDDKKILLLSKYSSKDSIPIDELTFLKKIFTAAKLNEDNIMFSDSVLKHQFDQVIGLGVNPFELGIKNTTFPYYEVKPYNNSVYLFADDIPVIMTDKNKKGGLWSGLKRMFDL